MLKKVEKKVSKSQELKDMKKKLWQKKVAKEKEALKKKRELNKKKEKPIPVRKALKVLDVESMKIEDMENFLNATGSSTVKLIKGYKNDSVETISFNLELFYFFQHNPDLYNLYFSDKIHDKNFKIKKIKNKHFVISSIADALSVVNVASLRVKKLLDEKFDGNVEQMVLSCLGKFTNESLDLKEMVELECITVLNEIKSDSIEVENVLWKDKSEIHARLPKKVNKKNVINIELFNKGFFDNIIDSEETLWELMEGEVEFIDLFNDLYFPVAKKMDKKSFYSKIKSSLIDCYIHAQSIYEPINIGMFTDDGMKAYFREYLINLKKTPPKSHGNNILMALMQLNILNNYSKEKKSSYHSSLNKKNDVVLSNADELDKYLLIANGAKVVPAMRDKSKHANYGLISNLFLKDQGSGVQERTIFNEDLSKLDWVLPTLDYNEETLPMAILPGSKMIVIDVDMNKTPVFNGKFIDGEPIFEFEDETLGKTDFTRRELRENHKCLEKSTLTQEEKLAIVKEISGDVALYQESPSGGLHVYISKDKFTNGIYKLDDDFSGSTWFNAHGQYIDIIVNGKRIVRPFDYRTTNDNLIQSWSLDGRRYSNIKTIGVNKSSLITNPNKFDKLGNYEFFKKLTDRNCEINQNELIDFEVFDLELDCEQNEKVYRENQEKIFNENSKIKSLYNPKLESYASKLEKASRMNTNDKNIMNFLLYGDLKLDFDKVSSTSNLEFYCRTAVRTVINTSRNHLRMFTVDELTEQVNTLIKNVIGAFSGDYRFKIKANEMSKFMESELALSFEGPMPYKRENLETFLSLFGKSVNSFKMDAFLPLKRDKRFRTHKSESINDGILSIKEIFSNTSDNNVKDGIVLDMVEFPELVNSRREFYGNEEYKDPRSIQKTVKDISMMSKLSKSELYLCTLINYSAHRKINDKKTYDSPLKDDIEFDLNSELYTRVPDNERTPNRFRQIDIKILMEIQPDKVALFRDMSIVSDKWLYVYTKSKNTYLNKNLEQDIESWTEFSKDFYRDLANKISKLENGFNIEDTIKSKYSLLDNFHSVKPETLEFISMFEVSTIKGRNKNLFIKEKEEQINFLSVKEAITRAKSIVRNTTKSMIEKRCYEYFVDKFDVEVEVYEEDFSEELRMEIINKISNMQSFIIPKCYLDDYIADEIRMVISSMIGNVKQFKDYNRLLIRNLVEEKRIEILNGEINAKLMERQMSISQ